jgi:hypothetical protein
MWNGLVRDLVACGSAVRDAARFAGAAAVRLTERAIATGGRLAHAGAVRGAAGLSAAVDVSTRTVHAVCAGTQATTAYSVRTAIGHTAALSHVAWDHALRMKARVYHDSPVLRVNFAAVPPRSGDVRVATTMALVSTGVLTVAVMLIGLGMALLLRPRTLGPVPVAVAAPLRAAVPAPIEPTASEQRRLETVAPRRPAPAAKVAATKVAATKVPATKVAAATIAPKPAEPSTLSAERVRAIWDKTDTRSLDRGIAEMRRATLAFRRCEMRMTSPDMATATCSEAASPRVAWNFDFRRSDDRWHIDGVSTTGTAPEAR